MNKKMRQVRDNKQCVIGESTLYFTTIYWTLDLSDDTRLPRTSLEPQGEGRLVAIYTIYKHEGNLLRVKFPC